MSEENNKKKLSEEDYLKNHLSNLDSSNTPTFENKNKENESKSSSKVDELNYFNFTAEQLPCGKFYPKGTSIMIRPAQVKEIQAYSMVDDENFYDMVSKMNNMLQSCVRVKYPDGSLGTYLDVKDQDRIFLIFSIRELTFQDGNELSVKTSCEACNEEVNIELKRENFVYNEVENLDKYYNNVDNCYHFELKNGKTYNITPPNIGLQKSFTNYLMEERNEEKEQNLSFLKIIPFTLGKRTSISNDGIKAKLKEFENMDDISFQFLNAAVGKLTFGIKELRKKCVCGEEIHTDMVFPNGASGIFVIHNAFEAYIKE